MDDRRSEHWDGTYSAKRPEETSWFEVEPTTSLALIDGAVEPSTCIDVGAGRSTLVDALLIRGWSSVTVLDLSGAALDAVQQPLPAVAAMPESLPDCATAPVTATHCQCACCHCTGSQWQCVPVPVALISEWLTQWQPLAVLPVQ